MKEDDAEFTDRADNRSPKRKRGTARELPRHSNPKHEILNKFKARMPKTLDL